MRYTSTYVSLLAIALVQCISCQTEGGSQDVAAAAGTPNVGGSAGNPGIAAGGSAAGVGGVTTVGGSAGTGGTDTMSIAGASAGCDFAPKANAAETKLAFEQLQLDMGVPVDSLDKNQGLLDGFTELNFVPGSADEVVLLQKRGRIHHMRLEGDPFDRATLIKTFDLPAVDVTEDCGLIAAEFDPDFATNHFIYFSYCTGPKASNVMRYTFEGGELGDPVEIISWDGTGAPNTYHTVGSIVFDESKNLLVSHGDFMLKQSQDLDLGLGKLLRVIPSRQPGVGGYEPAPDNPFFGEAKPKSAIWAYGLRSPWKILVNSHGHIVIGDVGPNQNEEVNVVTAPGQNFGWDENETSGPCAGDCVSPVTYWFNGGNDDAYLSELENEIRAARMGRIVWVGAEYGDCGNDRYGGALTGVLLFGDYITGWVRGMVLDAAGTMLVDKQVGELGGISSWAQGRDGYLYLTTLGPYNAATTERPGLYRAVLATEQP